MEASKVNKATAREAARQNLRRKGYEILESDWVCAAGEADFIARDGEAVAFVKVKVDGSVADGLRADSYDDAERGRWERIAMLYLSGTDLVNVPVRFDVMTVAPFPDGERCLIRHHVDVTGGR